MVKVTVNPSVRAKANDAFTVARRRVFFQRVLGFFTGQAPESLLSFDEIRHKLRVRGQHYAGLQTIPLDRITGSVGRYQEFNRAFLPTQDFIRERWKRVYEVAHSLEGFPPIDVYQIGDVYFVRDGHHRVSVLKELGATTVEATVTRLETAIPLAADVGKAELDLKEEYAAFLEETGLDVLRPEERIEFTLPGQYRKLYEHIAVHRYHLGRREEREIPWSEAVARWRDEVYLPMVRVIREEWVLDAFPGRTEADLYLWIIEHRHYVGERYEQEVPLEQAAIEFSKEFGRGSGKKQLKADAKKAKGRGKTQGSARTVAVFGSGSAPPNHPVLEEAERLGRLLAEAGFVLVNGGYGGTMEAGGRGAQQAGGQVVGVTMDLFTPPKEPNPWLTREQRVKDFFPRLKRLTRADAFVVLRGGIGTLTEATLVWSLIQTGQLSSRPFLFVGDGWRQLFDAFRAETFMREDDFSLATVLDSVEEAVAVLREALAPTP
ncbi:MAG TPA: DUF4032 domain-containing protein [Anaerolineae bacterium]|nr:DUF4032 domain-containing protein [Anaerolineae bacterium]